MPTLQSVGRIEQCLHENATGELRIRFVPGDHRGLGVISPLKCPDCGKDIYLTNSSGAPIPQVAFGLLDEYVPPKPMPKAQPQTAQPAKDRKAEAEQGIVNKLGGDGVGTRLALGFFRQGYTMSCQACDAAATNMNSLGPAGCREQMDALVEEMLPRAEEWATKAHPLAKKIGALVGADKALIRRELRSHVEAAITAFEAGVPLTSPAAE